MKIKDSRAFSECIWIELISLVALVMQDSDKAIIVLRQYPEVNICQWPQTNIIIYRLQESNPLEEYDLYLFFG